MKEEREASRRRPLIFEPAGQRCRPTVLRSVAALVARHADVACLDARDMLATAASRRSSVGKFVRHAVRSIDLQNYRPRETGRDVDPRACCLLLGVHNRRMGSPILAGLTPVDYFRAPAWNHRNVTCENRAWSRLDRARSAPASEINARKRALNAEGKVTQMEESWGHCMYSIPSLRDYQLSTPSIVVNNTNSLHNV